MAVTPNRAYLYPTPADPTDVPFYMQGLAEGLDRDLNALNFITRPRPMAQIAGTVTNTVPGTAVQGTLTWQLTDYNTRSWVGPPSNLANGATAIVPVTGVNTQLLTVNYTGFWYLFANCQLETTNPAAGIDMAGVELVISTGGGTVVGRKTVHDTSFIGDLTHIIDVSAGVRLTAGTQVSLRAVVGRSSGSNPYSFGRRSITLMRMTET